MSDNDMIRRGDALKARTLWMQIDGEGRIESICTAPFPDHDAYISYRAIEAIPAATQPDPRDEVIAALVDASSPFVAQIQNADFGRQLREYDALVAALAAAKAVQP